jgi:hypothetical protein
MSKLFHFKNKNIIFVDSIKWLNMQLSKNYLFN